MAVPYAFPPPPVVAPAQVAAPAPEQTAIEKAAVDLNKKDSSLNKDLDELSKSISPKPNPQAAAAAATISPMAPDQSAGIASQAAQALMAQLIQKRQNRMGTTLTGRPY
jgi:hypothetical protein